VSLSQLKREAKRCNGCKINSHEQEKDGPTVSPSKSTALERRYEDLPKGNRGNFTGNRETHPEHIKFILKCLIRVLFSNARSSARLIIVMYLVAMSMNGASN
jgi:hypothetical protein